MDKEVVVTVQGMEDGSKVEDNRPNNPEVQVDILKENE
jgi:hypothetical protein